MNVNRNTVYIFLCLVLAFATVFSAGCNKRQDGDGKTLLGTFKFVLNPATGSMEITPFGNTPKKFLRLKEMASPSELEPLYNLGWENSLNYASGVVRVRPTNCGVGSNYERISRILTASVKLVSQTDCSEGTYCGETYSAPLELRIYSIVASGICDTVCDPNCNNPACISEGSPLFTQASLVSMNHNSGCDPVEDSDSNGFLDCMADDPNFIYTEPDYIEYTYHPTWDYTLSLDTETQTPPQALDPGEHSGCKFLQFTFSHPQLDNTHIPLLAFYADVLGYVFPEPGQGLPSPSVGPAVSPTNISSQNLTVTLDSVGDYVADSVRITGGASEVNCIDNDPCDSNPSVGTVTVSVNLNANVTNNLYVYQKDTVLPYLNTSPATLVQIIHDNIPPQVSIATPLQNATNISPGTNILVTFNEQIDASTINTTTLSLRRGATVINGVVSLSADKYTATFDPNANLQASSNHTYTVLGGTLPCSNCVKDLAGNPLAVNYISSFTTASSDTTPPTVISTNPPDNANGISIDTTIQIVFSEAVNPSSLTSTTLSVTLGGSPVSGALELSVDGRTATFTPSSLLEVSSEYRVTVKGAPAPCITDLAGNNMASNHVFFFTTGTAADTTPPTVVSTNPENMGTNISESVAPYVIFSEPINPATINTSTIVLKRSDETLINSSVSLSSDGLTATLTPYSVLENSTTYVLTIGESIADYAGNALGIPQTVQFITRSEPDTTPPTVTATSPYWYQAGVSLYTSMTVIFSEPVDPATISTATIRMLRDGTTPVPGTVELSSDGYTAYFWQQSPPLVNNTGYYINILGGANGVKDKAGNALASTFSSFFRTNSAAPGAPYIQGVSPSAGSTGVPTNTNIIVKFSEAVLSTTVTDASFYLRIPPSTSHIAGTITVLQDKIHARFNPTVDLNPNTTYSFHTTTGIRDISNSRQFTASATSFTTGASADSDGPTVVSIDPAHESTNIERWQDITITFNEPIDPTTISVASLALIRQYDSSSIPISVSLSNNGLVATINPIDLLPNYESFKVKVKTSIRNLSGYALQSYTESVFQTKDTSSDTTAPFVQSTVPADGAQNQPRTNFTAVIYMSEPIDPDSAIDGNFSIDNGDVTQVQPVTITISDQGAGDPNPGRANSKVTMTCYITLARRAWYRIYVDHNLVDYAGNNMVADQTFDFRTGN